jgi:LacI family transcriptional regulator
MTQKRTTKRSVLLLISGLNATTHRGVALAAREFGWHLDLSFMASSRLPRNWRGDGILCALTDHPEMIAYIQASTLPMVDISMQHPEIVRPRVVADNRAIGQTAAQHLLDYEYPHFAWFALQSDPVGEARFQGFQAAISSRVHRLDGPDSDDRKRITHRLKRLPRPCAIFAKTDVDAAWIMSVCLEAGYNVPDDIAIIGVDNNPLICEFLQVPLTSVNHNLEKLGYQSAKLLHQLMNGEPAPTETLLIPPQGVTPRASTDGFAVQDPLVRSALIFMKSHLGKAIGIREIAESVGASRRTLEVRFQQCIGTTVHHKLMELRLIQAERLLRTTSDSSETIAARAGFCHAQHLSRLFKQRYGEPPLRYRKRCST